MKYKEYKDQIKQEQEGMTNEEVLEYMKKKSEYAIDLDNLEPIKHNWIDRGAKMSCEHAGHPFHQAFKRGARMVR